MLKIMPIDSLSAVSPPGLSSAPEYYGIQDLHFGDALVINRHSFVLLVFVRSILNLLTTHSTHALAQLAFFILASN